MFPPFLAPDAHHCDIQIRHLQPKRERVKNEIDAYSNGDANEKLGDINHVGRHRGSITAVVHEVVKLNETDRCYQ